MASRTDPSVGARRELHEDIRRPPPQLQRGHRLRQAIVEEGDRVGRERAGLAGPADDLEPQPHELAVVAHRERAEPPDRRIVEQHEPAAAEVQRIAGDDVPGKAPAGEVLQGIDDRRLLRPAGQGHRHEPDDQVVGAEHARDRPDPLHVRLGEGVGEVDIRRVPRGHPEVGVEPLDRDRGALQHPQEDADLDDDQHDRERDPGDGRQESASCRTAGS